MLSHRDYISNIHEGRLSSSQADVGPYIRSAVPLLFITIVCGVALRSSGFFLQVTLAA